MKLIHWSLIIALLWIMCFSGAVQAQTFYPDKGLLYYSGNRLAESYFKWLNPGGWSVNDPGYEHDLELSPKFIKRCSTLTTLPSSYDDCETAGVAEQDPNRWIFSFGTFHAKKIQRNKMYWGAWHLWGDLGQSSPFQLAGQEVEYKKRYGIDFCKVLGLPKLWCMDGTSTPKHPLPSGTFERGKTGLWKWGVWDVPTPTLPPTPPNPSVPQPIYSNINLYVISKSQTGTNRTEVHILNGANKYRQWLLHTGTPLEMTGDNFKFLIADYNRDGVSDVIVIKKSDTGTNRTEVHVLSGASNFQSWLLHTGTPLEMTWSNFDFAMGDYNRDGVPDLIIIKKSDTGTNSTEVHVLSGASKFQSWLLHTGTHLQRTGDTFDFTMGDYNRDGYPDLVVLSKMWTGTGRTEVHILNGANKFQSWLVQTGTPLHETGDNFDFTMGDYNRDGTPDLVIIKKNDSGTNSTEVHVLSGASKFQSWLLHTGTPLHQTGNTFEFGMSSN